MKTINIRQAKAHLLQLVTRAAKGEPFIIAKAGKPLVQVIALKQAEPVSVERLGFMAGEIAIPEDFDQMGRVEIEKLFNTGA